MIMANKITDLIKALEEIKEKEGNLMCFDANFFLGPRLQVRENKGEYDKAWKMPKRFLFIGEEK